MSTVKKFLIDCPNCEEYEVEEEVFMSYLNKGLIRRVRAELAKDAVAVKLKLKDGCRECREALTTPGTIVIVKLKHLHKN